MNIDHFIYFIETVKKQSFTKAAESLFISQSTISKAIRSLERAYDTELIDRTAKKFKLTSAGEIFYHGAVKIVSNYKSETEVLSALLKSARGTPDLRRSARYDYGRIFYSASISIHVSGH